MPPARPGGSAGSPAPGARWRTSPSQPPICRRTSRVSPRTCPRSSLRRAALRWVWGPAASRSRRRSNRRRVRRTARRVRSGARRPWQRPRLLPARQAIRALARTVRVRRPLQLRRRVAPSALTIPRPRQPPRLRRAVLVARVVCMIRRPRQRRPLLLRAARAIRCRCRPALRTSPHRFRRRSRVSRYPCLPEACTTRSLSRRVVRMSQHRFRPPGRVSRLCRLLRATACRRLLLSCSTTRRRRCRCRPVDRPVRLRLSARIHRRRLHQRLRTSSPRGDPQKCQRPTAARTVLARVALRAGTRRASHRTAASQVVMGTAVRRQTTGINRRPTVHLTRPTGKTLRTATTDQRKDLPRKSATKSSPYPKAVVLTLRNICHPDILRITCRNSMMASLDLCRRAISRSMVSRSAMEHHSYAQT